MRACDLLCVEGEGRAAAAVVSYPNDGYHDLAHSDQDFGFRSVRNAQILSVAVDRVLIWGKREGEARGLYEVIRGDARLLHRLDRLDGVRHVGQALVPYGRNVDDPDGSERYVWNDKAYQVSTCAARCVTDRGMIVSERNGFWLTERLYGARGSELLRSLGAEVTTCLPLRWHGETVLVVERNGVWSLIWRGEEFPLRVRDDASGSLRVIGVWTSPNEASIALLVSYDRRADDPSWLPPIQKLLVTRRPDAKSVSIVASGRFNSEPFTRPNETIGAKPVRLVWSADGYGLAAILDTVKRGFDDEFEEVPERQPILAGSNGDLMVGDAGDVFTDVAVRSNGSVAAYVKDDGSECIVSAADGEIARHAFAWQPQTLPAAGFTYAFVDGAEVRFATAR